MINAFQQYLIKEKSSENLDFIEAVENYSLTKKTPEEMINGLKVIHEKFIKLNSEKEINITSSLRKKILKKIEPQLKEKNEWILEIPYHEVLRKKNFFLFNIFRKIERSYQWDFDF